MVSPHGIGLDCHQKWESLLLGCIPIVKTSAIDQLYSHLPILIVNERHDINAAYLGKKFDEIINQEFDFNPLFRDYWSHKLKSRARTFVKPMTFAQFRDLICVHDS